MGAFLTTLSEKILALFKEKEIELVVVGLENAGKTTLLTLLASGEQPSLDTLPTIGLNVVTFQKGGLTMKCWDLGGQVRYRPEWGRYAKGCNVIVFVVDSADSARFPECKQELHRLLEDPTLSKVPLLIISNKIDLTPHANENEIISALNLDYITEQPWVIFPISALKQINIEQVVEWLAKQG